MSVSGGGREALAEALFSESADLAEVVNRVFALPSAPAIQVLAHAVGRVKSEIYALLDSAARFDAAACEGERDGDRHRVVLCSGQVMGFASAAGRLAEALVDVFDVWRQYERHRFPGNHLYERAVDRHRRIRRSGPGDRREQAS